MLAELNFKPDLTSMKMCPLYEFMGHGNNCYVVALFGLYLLAEVSA
jgi:hypothetical protein